MKSTTTPIYISNNQQAESQNARHDNVQVLVRRITRSPFISDVNYIPEDLNRKSTVTFQLSDQYSRFLGLMAGYIHLGNPHRITIDKVQHRFSIEVGQQDAQEVREYIRRLFAWFYYEVSYRLELRSLIKVHQLYQAAYAQVLSTSRQRRLN